MKIQITKCYLVQILDDAGNEIDCDYDFVNTKAEAMETGKEMIESIKRGMIEE